MTKYIRIFSLAVASLLIAVLLPSCTSEEPSGTKGRSVIFAAAIGEESQVDTRAGITFNPVSSNIEVPFYIKAEVATASGRVYEQAKYKVAPGTMGRLSADDGQEEILWYNKSDSHTFYAWTMPWQEDTKFSTDPGADSEISFLPSTYQKEGAPISSEPVNCGVMEHFIATKTEPLTYNRNGELVEMYFQHLVSKIKIDATRLIVGDLSGEAAEAYMTFLDMPQKGTFHRRPKDDGRAPYVEKNENGDKGVTYWIGNGNTTLYVCPEVDFSNMRFAIHLNDGQGNRSDYYGDFKSVIFKRPDEDLGDWDKDKEPTVLYAGEEMTIRFAVRNDNADIFTVNISPWKDIDREGISHAKQGAYTTTELLDIYKKFTKEGGYTAEDVDEIFEMFGTEDENGDKVIYMYEDLETTHSRFPLDRSLILDGMGHVLKIANSTREGYEYCARTPCCRNIFLTNGDGEHMIYIDENYQIWIVNPNTLEMTKTGNELEPRPLSERQGSYYIDYETGKVIYISSSI